MYVCGGGMCVWWWWGGQYLRACLLVCLRLCRYSAEVSESRIDVGTIAMGKQIVCVYVYAFVGVRFVV